MKKKISTNLQHIVTLTQFFTNPLLLRLSVTRVLILLELFYAFSSEQNYIFVLQSVRFNRRRYLSGMVVDIVSGCKRALFVNELRLKSNE